MGIEKHGEWFVARDLLGVANYFWQGTPLMPLYTSTIWSTVMEMKSTQCERQDAQLGIC